MTTLEIGHTKYTDAEAISAVEGEATLVLAGTLSVAGNTNITGGDFFVESGNGAVIGHNAQISTVLVGEFQIIGVNAASSAQSFQRYEAVADGPNMVFVHSRGTVGGTPTIVQDADFIGAYLYVPSDGVDLDTIAARFICLVDDGTPAAGDIGTAFRMDQMPGGGGALRTTMLVSANARLSVGDPAATALAVIHADQASTTGAIPVLYLDQADVSEEMIEFNTTIGTGNAIEEDVAKTLTTTHFIKVTIPGGLTRYLQVGTIG